MQGTARASAEGECVRCLEPLTVEVDADSRRCSRTLTPTTGAADSAADPADDAEDDEDRFFLEDGLFDLESGARDAVVLALISGVGNIYADEALWRAKLHYDRPTATLTRPKSAELPAMPGT
ncbi:Formamidopyrimidine-DNA glycosylase [Streptomyces microflavus]